MSLWSQVQPLIAGCPYAASLQELIEKKSYGRFSKNIHGVTGYYHETFIVIIGRSFRDKKVEDSKKIYSAILIQTNETPLKAIPKVYKKVTSTQFRVLEILQTVHLHQDLFKTHPEGLAKPPIVLGTTYKRVIKKEEEFYKHRIETLEDEYPTTLSRNHLLKGKIALDQVLSGFEKVAISLEELHRQQMIHRDIKFWNLFVTEDKLLKLFDFDIGTVVGTLSREVTKYEFWDTLTNKYGLTHPFCDVYGWTISFATLLFGDKFYTTCFYYRSNPNFFLLIDEVMKKNETKLSQEILEAASKFVRNILIADRAAYVKIEGIYLSLCQAHKKNGLIAESIMNETKDLPTMKDCLLIARQLIQLI